MTRKRATYDQRASSAAAGVCRLTRATGRVCVGGLLVVAASLACDDSEPGAGADAGGFVEDERAVRPEPLKPPVQVTAERPLDIPLDLNCDGIQAVPSEGRLLTRVQYDNAVRDIFRGAVSGSVTSDFPREAKVFFFGTNQKQHRATPLLAETQMRAAERVSAQVIESLSELIICESATPDAACAERFLGEYGTRAYRRSLTAVETELLLGVFAEAQTEYGFESALALMIEVMLQSPQFLYRVDDVGGNEVLGEPVAVGAYELASRLSFLLWNSTPDDELLEQAASGDLLQPEHLESQVQRMLAHPSATTTLLEFQAQWLGVERLSEPSFVRELNAAADAEAETLYWGGSWRGSIDAFTADIMAGPEPTIQALLSSARVFVDSKLAGLYNVPLPSDLPEGAFFATELESEHRAGLLLQPALMALLAHPDESAPVQRGVFVLDRLLCEPPPPPPPGIAITPPDPDPNASTRQRFAVHTAAAACSGCHRFIDPIGFSFEGFDQLGRYRQEDHGVVVDETGDVVDSTVNIIEDSLEGPLADARELVMRLSESKQVEQCMVSQWYQFSMGRVQREVDLCSVRDLREQLASSGGNLHVLLSGLVTTDAFRYRLGMPGQGSQ